MLPLFYAIALLILPLGVHAAPDGVGLSDLSEGGGIDVNGNGVADDDSNNGTPLLGAVLPDKDKNGVADVLEASG